jgi:hypothetical protein
MRLRTCPICRSKAVSGFDRVEDEDGGVYVEVCCGECATWRTGEIGWRAADALERRLRRDRARLAISAGQSARWRDVDLGALVKGPPQGAARKTPR